MKRIPKWVKLEHDWLCEAPNNNCCIFFLLKNTLTQPISPQDPQGWWKYKEKYIGQESEPQHTCAHLSVSVSSYYQFSFSVSFFSSVDHHYLKANFIALLSYTKPQTELLENAGYFWMENLLSNTKNSPSFIMRQNLYCKANGAFQQSLEKSLDPCSLI